MCNNLTVNNVLGQINWEPGNTEWGIIDEWCSRKAQTRAHTIKILLKLGLASLCEQMGKEDAEADRVS